MSYTERDSTKRTVLKFGLSAVVLLAIVMIALLFSRNFSVLHVQGDSMYPTYNHGDIIIVKKKSVVKNGDIVVFSPNSSWSNNDKSAYIKRVIASTNDKVIVESDLSVNGQIVGNIILNGCNSKDNGLIEIPEKSLFVVGDNYPSSNDSLSQYCRDNDDFLVPESQVLFSGNEVFKMKGVFN